MKNKDFLFIKNELNKSYLLCDYLTIIKVGDNPKEGFNKIKIIYSNMIITISDGIGFAYLVSWWADGSITSSQANEITTICRKYNDRY